MGDDIRDTFKRSLNRLIEKTSVSQADLARILDVSPTTVNNWVKGYNVPRMDKIDMLCRGLAYMYYIVLSRLYTMYIRPLFHCFHRILPALDILSIITVSFVNSL